jgi:hypothetical protein
MTRKLGRIEQMIVDTLRAEHDHVVPGLTVRALARRLCGRAPTPSELSSINRALRRLEVDGLVEFRRPAVRRSMFPGRRVRLPSQTA